MLGFFDSDGTINISTKNVKNSQYIQYTLQVEVSNKYLEDVQYYKEHFGGNIYYDTSKNGYYKWHIQSQENIENFLSYFQTHIFKSIKSKRFFMIHDFYKLKTIKAYRENSIYHKVWKKFYDKWNKVCLIFSLFLVDDIVQYSFIYKLYSIQKYIF